MNLSPTDYYPVDIEATTGCSDSHLVNWNDTTLLHRGVVEPWQRLCEAARSDGFELAIASAYRSFSRQLLIWNDKLQGLRPVFDDDGHRLNLDHLSSLERVAAVMRWSALPGASRHHWGTDMDIYDLASMTEGYQLQLSPAEYEGDGLFAPMITWLSDYLQKSGSADFFFPYRVDSGGIMPEPWHLSYRPVAEPFERAWTQQHFLEQIKLSDIQEKQCILEHFDELYERFIHASLSASLNED